MNALPAIVGHHELKQATLEPQHEDQHIGEEQLQNEQGPSMNVEQVVGAKWAPVVGEFARCHWGSRWYRVKVMAHILEDDSVMWEVQYTRTKHWEVVEQSRLKCVFACDDEEGYVEPPMLGSMDSGEEQREDEEEGDEERLTLWKL